MKNIKKYIVLALVLAMGFIYNEYIDNTDSSFKTQEVSSLSDIEDYSGSDFVNVNNNVPFFTDEDKKRGSFEEYGDLDSLGRCTEAFAIVSKETMPTEKRGSIGMIKPTGWHTVKYDRVNGKYLYNRCHLIGYQLTGENANPNNLITCTRQMNSDVMLMFENRVANYVKDSEGRVLYRVTPYFEGDNLLSKGVLMEAYSLDDNGKGLMFNVFVYNVQDGISIDYATGESRKE